jgi:polyisoprenoid-binding protein YceI
MPRLIVLAALALFAATPAFAGMKVEGKPKVVFTAVGNPGFLDIEGVTSELFVADDGTTLTFRCPLAGLDTGIGLRDDHMKHEFLQIETWPEATLSFPKSLVAWPTVNGQSAKGQLTAQFSAHGVTRDAKVDYTVKRGQTGWKVTAKFPFDISQHGIDVPSYLGVTVEPAMNANVAFDLVDAP